MSGTVARPNRRAKNEATDSSPDDCVAANERLEGDPRARDRRENVVVEETLERQRNSEQRRRGHRNQPRSTQDERGARRE